MLDEDQIPDPGEDTKRCPRCQLLVPQDAQMCYHCRRGFKWHRLRLSLLVPTLISAISVAIASLSLVRSTEATNSQVRQEQRTEEETSAPILVPQILPNERGQMVSVLVHYPDSFVRKRADLLFIDRNSSPGEHNHRGRIVIPISNDGPGVALTVGQAVMVSSCTQAAILAPLAKAGRFGPLGTFAVTSHSTTQLGFLAPRNVHSVSYLGTDQGGHTRVLFYSRTYNEFGLPYRGETFSKLVLFYTDATQRYLRWACADYKVTTRDHAHPYARFIHATVDDQTLRDTQWHLQ